MTRAERAEQAAILAEEGHNAAEIGRRLGISRSYASSLVDDPTGAKDRARKDRYRGTCERCGAKTDGSNGRALAPSLCLDCFGLRRVEERPWKPEAVLAAVAAANDVAVELLGRPICASDWTSHYYSQRLSATRIDEARRLWEEADRRGIVVPCLDTIARVFGSWPAVAFELGIPAAPQGGPSHRARVAA